MPFIAAGGAALSAVGSIQEGEAARASGKYNQQLAEQEAEALEIKAGQEIAVGTHNSARIQKRTKEILAQQRAQAAAGGGSTSDATAVTLRQEAIETGSLDDLINMAEAQEVAQQTRHGAEVKRGEGRIARMRGNQAARAGYMRAGTSILKGGVDLWDAKFG